MNGTERPRILSLDLLESYARELDIDVRLERGHQRGLWSCTLVARGEGSPVVPPVRPLVKRFGGRLKRPASNSRKPDAPFR